MHPPPPVRASSPTSQRRVKEAEGGPFTGASTHIGIRRLARVGHPRPTEGCSRPILFGQVQWWQSSWGGRWSSKKPALQKVRGSTRHSPLGAQQTPCWGLLGSPRPGSSLRPHIPSTRLQGLGMMKLLFSWDWGRAERQGFAPLNHLPPVWASVQGMKGPVAPHGLRSPVFSCPAPYRPPGNTGSFGGGGQVLAAGPWATQWAQDGEEGVTGSGDRAVGGVHRSRARVLQGGWPQARPFQPALLRFAALREGWPRACDSGQDPGAVQQASPAGPV